MMQPGDRLFLALQRDGTMLAIITSSATIENQLTWLFGLEEQEPFAFTYQDWRGQRRA